MHDLERRFEHELVNRAGRLRASRPPVELPPRTEFKVETRSSSRPGKCRCAHYNIFCVCSFVSNCACLIFINVRV